MNPTVDVLYWTAAVAAELKEVAGNTTVGSRNSQLFELACTIFGIVKAGERHEGHG